LSLQNSPLVYIEGGIGDFLQILPILLVNKHQKFRYLICSHFKGTKELLRMFGIKPQYFIEYTHDDEKGSKLVALNIKEPLIMCPRAFFIDRSPFKPSKPVFKNDRKTIGVHLNGSKNAKEARIKEGKVQKELPPKIVNDLAQEYNVLLFGLPEEIQATNLEQSDHIKFITYLDVAKSLSYITQCDAVVASDSSIKTMSSMIRIPTFVWMGDYIDVFRDQWFITPYVNDGCMETFVYKNQYDQYDEGMTKTKEFLKRKLNELLPT